MTVSDGGFVPEIQVDLEGNVWIKVFLLRAIVLLLVVLVEDGLGTEMTIELGQGFPQLRVLVLVGLHSSGEIFGTHQQEHGLEVGREAIAQDGFHKNPDRLQVNPRNERLREVGLAPTDEGFLRSEVSDRQRERGTPTLNFSFSASIFFLSALPVLFGSNLKSLTMNLFFGGEQRKKIVVTHFLSRACTLKSSDTFLNKTTLKRQKSLSSSSSRAERGSTYSTSFS